jgi:radical SAM protein
MNFSERPILVFWESTRACLLACKHCRAEAIKESLPGTLSHPQAADFIKSLIQFKKPFPILVITGGDPLMRDDILDLVNLARDLEIPVALSPAVSPKFDPNLFITFKKLGVKALSISLDGAHEKTHDKVRGVPGHFQQTMEMIKFLVSQGFSLQINTTVMRENVEEMADLAHLLKTLKVSIWEVFFLIQTGRGKAVNPISPEEHEEVCHFLVDVSYYGIIVRTVEAPFFRRVVDWRKTKDKSEYYPSPGPLYQKLSKKLAVFLGERGATCLAQTQGTRDGNGIIFVGYNGDIYPAGFLPFPLGNVKENPLQKIYSESSLLKAIRNGDFTGKCGLCDYKTICGGSRARAYTVSNDPLGEDPACPYLPNPNLIKK